MTIKFHGSWTKDELPNIGITDELAEHLRTHRLTRVPFNGILEYDEFRDPTAKPKSHVFRIVALEPAMADDGTDPDRRGEQTLQMIDQARKERSLLPVEQTLFDHPPGGWDDDDEDGEPGGQMRLGQDGPHAVPPPSGEELTAELDERRKGKTPPPAEFSGGTDD